VNTIYTDWIQAFASVAAILVAYWAFRVSKSALEINKEQMELNKSQYEVAKATVELSKQISYASHRCIIYPERVKHVNGGYWNITFRNNGVGVAFDVKVKIYLRAKLDQTTEPIPMDTEGSKVINPQSEQSYVTSEGEKTLHILQETPIIIHWEELSGIKNEAHWYWSANSHGDENFSLKKHIRIEDSV